MSDDRPLYHPDLTPEEDRRRAIADVLTDQAAKEHEWRKPIRPPSTTWRRFWALLVVLLVSFYVWFASPAWLEPGPPPPIPEERIEAGLRMAIYIQAQQVEQFRDQRGRLPDVLEETGEPLPGLRYERLDARTYRIRAFGGERTVMYLSTDSLRGFARDSDRVVGIGP